MQTKNTPIWLQALPVLLIVLFFMAQIYLNYGNLLPGASPAELIVNVLLLSIPLGLLCFSIWLLAAARYVMNAEGRLNAKLSRVVYHTPRLAGVLIAVFAATFALDVFGMGLNFRSLLGELLLSLLPALVIGVVVALAWRWEWIGTLAFSLLAVFFLSGFLVSLEQGLAMLLTFSAPMAAVAALFWLNWQLRRKSLPAERPDVQM